MHQPEADTKLLDYSPASETFRQEVLDGLSSRPRSLPCKYFYDERGSQLFDSICESDDYYLTRVELDIMSRYAGEMAQQIGQGAMLVEYGSGSSIKTRLLLDALESPVAYVPVDISAEHLQASALKLASLYPEVEVLPVCADFTEPFSLPTSTQAATHNAVYFPGSTIGNFQPEAAEKMLRRIVDLCGCGGGLLIGVDLQKSPSVLERAYNDSEGVTAEFNMNLLERINRELDGGFRTEHFEHQAAYNQTLHCIEIGLVSQREQIATVGDVEFAFEEGERIHTEYSYKYTVEGFAELAKGAGLTLRRSWTDEQRRVAVLHLAILDDE